VQAMLSKGTLPKNRPEIKSKAQRVKLTIEIVTKKYGPDFIKDLELLKNQPFWSIYTMAAKYEISKQRVSQLFKKIFGEPVKKYKFQKLAKVSADIGLLNTQCNKYHFNSKRSTGIVRVYEKCIDLGFDTSWAAGRVDLVVNDYRIGVSSNFTKSIKPNSQHKARYLAFVVTMSKLEHVDFYILYAAFSAERWFVIPSEISKNYQGRSNYWAIYIPEKVEKTTKNIYWKYEDAWDQLKGK